MLFGRFFPFRRRNEPLEVPSRKLIERTGFSVEELRAGAILPQLDPNSASGYCLIIADLDSIDSEAFGAAGVEVRRGSIDQIEHAWSVYLDTETIQPAADFDRSIQVQQEEPIGCAFSPTIINTLARLASDAAEQGATEVFIGYPAAEDFEFLGTSSRFRGQIDSGLGHAIARNLPEGEVYRTTLTEADGSAIRRLIIGCVRELNRPVVYLSWDSGAAGGSKKSGNLNSKSSANSSDHIGPSGSIDLGEDGLNGEGNQVLMAFPSTPQTPDGGGSSIKTIVLVDDDIRYLTIVGCILRRRGWIVHEALRAVTGLELVHRFGGQIDLVIADVRMPEMDGMAFLGQLRQKMPDLPVLMLTSDREEAVEIAAANTGANGFVLKQKELNILLAWVCRLLGQPFIAAETNELEVPPVQ